MRFSKDGQEMKYFLPSWADDPPKTVAIAALLAVQGG